MIPYYIFLAIVMALALMHDNIAFRYKKVFVVLIYVAMVLFAGLRDSCVGTDSGSYARTFTNSTYETSPWEDNLEDAVTSEPGFWLLKKLLHVITGEYYILFIGIAAISYFCILKSLKLATARLALPLLVFICLGLYSYPFNAARQAIAIAIYTLSFRYIYDKKFVKYAVVVFIAMLFHRTAVIAFPLYFLFNIKFSTKNLIIISAIGAAVGAMLPSLLSYASSQEERYQLYEFGFAKGGQLLTLFYILMTAYFIIQRKNIDIPLIRAYDIFLNMILFGTMIFVLVQISGVYVEITRFAAYFHIAMIFIWSLIYQSSKHPKSAITSLIVVLHLIYYYIYMSKIGGLTPYIFNESIFGESTYYFI